MLKIIKAFPAMSSYIACSLIYLALAVGHATGAMPTPLGLPINISVGLDLLFGLIIAKWVWGRLDHIQTMHRLIDISTARVEELEELEEGPRELTVNRMTWTYENAPMNDFAEKVSETHAEEVSETHAEEVWVPAVVIDERPGWTPENLDTRILFVSKTHFQFLGADAPSHCTDHPDHAEIVAHFKDNYGSLYGQQASYGLTIRGQETLLFVLRDGRKFMRFTRQGLNVFDESGEVEGEVATESPEHLAEVAHALMSAYVEEYSSRPSLGYEV